MHERPKALLVGPTDIIAGTAGFALAIVIATFLSSAIGLSTDNKLIPPIAVGFVIVVVLGKRKLFKITPRRRKSTVLGLPTMLLLVFVSVIAALGFIGFPGHMGKHVDEGLYAMLYYGWQKGGMVLIVGLGMVAVGTLLFQYVLTEPFTEAQLERLRER